MRPYAVIAAAAAAALALAAPSYAHPQVHKHWQDMTIRERQAVVNKEIWHARTTVHWWLRHRPHIRRVPETATAPWKLCRAIGIRGPGPVCTAGQRLVRALALKAVIDQKLALEAAQQQTNNAYLNAWTCIHNGEGAWNANTGNGFYGGLQMDYGFMSTYGPEFLARWGTADNWPPWAQIETAQRAHDSGRGYSPWPNTARACGLI
jgi:transglycosylase-like protein